MSGFKIGPRAFNWMTTRHQFSFTGTDDDDWTTSPSINGANRVAVYESKLDLRAFNTDAGTALALLNVSIQESGPIVGSTTNPDYPVYCTVLDLISSVKIPIRRWMNTWDDVDAMHANFPSFLNKWGTFKNDDPAIREYNTSQIIYGKWRVWSANRNLMAANATMMELVQAGEFGSGEVLTAPHAYYYRVVVLADDKHTVYIPPAICSTSAAIVDLPEYVELAQMARLGQR
jgi:hypothetical protein